jgi:hypothetical protein
MKRLVFPLFTTLVFFASPLVIRADFVSWSYNFTPSSLAIPADSPGTGGLTLTNEPTKQADGTSDVVVTNIRAFSSAPRNHPDTFTHANFSFSLVLTDLASHQSATTSFSGFFSGSISQTSSNVQATYTAPLTRTLSLGGHTYTVNLGNYSPPGPPDASNAGSISAHVAVDEFTPPPPTTGGGGGPPTNDAPEPSTLLLSALGLSSLGLAGWRKWRRRMVTVAGA